MVLWAVCVWEGGVWVHKKLVSREMVEKENLEEEKDENEDKVKDDDHLLGALEGVVGPFLPWVVSYSSVQIVEFEDKEVNMEMVLRLVLLVIAIH